jgi:hypothetical protein
MLFPLWGGAQFRSIKNLDLEYSVKALIIRRDDRRGALQTQNHRATARTLPSAQRIDHQSVSAQGIERLPGRKQVF